MLQLKTLLRNVGIFRIIKYLYIRLLYLIQILKSGYLPKKIHSIYEVNIIGDPSKHCFFGYYDKSPWNNSNDKILYIKTGAKTSKLNSKAEICFFDLENKKSYVVEETPLWNWQQGSMLQWRRKKKTDTIIFNTIKPEENIFCAKEVDLDNKKEIYHDLPIYSINSNQSKYSSINFERLYHYAPGYGYITNKSFDSFDDDTDGIWLCDFTTGDKNMILSLNDIKFFESKESFKNSYNYINHVDFTPDDESIIFIHRWFKRNEHFKSRLLIYNFETKNLRVLLDNDMVSHFCWINERELLIFANNIKNQKGYFILNIDDGKYELYSKILPIEDGHPNFKPNSTNFLLFDTYPDRMREQKLYLFSKEKEKLFKLGSFYSPFKYDEHKRCDLHPRWNNSGNQICFDATFSGKRTLNIINIED